MSLTAQITLVVATVLCGLVAGFLFAFAVVIMPGIRRMTDRDFVRAFQEVDGVIQRGQPLFGLVWLGSALALIAGVAFGYGQIADLDRILLVAAGALFLFGVQLPTFVVNVPLNNALQALKLDNADDAACGAARERFETRWNRWNLLRTYAATATVALLAVILVRS